MELEMNWDGNPSIVLDIKTRLGVALPVQVFLNSLFVWSLCGLLVFYVFNENALVVDY